MKKHAEIISAVLLGLPLITQAYTSSYSSMAVPGSHNEWSTTPTMVLVADNVWVCTQTFSSASGVFKFAANGYWHTNWGGSATIARVPATASAPDPFGSNLVYSCLSNGPYRITFNDSTKQFLVQWAGTSPLPIPSITELALVGDFNGWTPTSSSMLFNSPANTNLWVGYINLEGDTAFQFFLNYTADCRWGAPNASTIVITNLLVPVTNSACGMSSYTITNLVPGTYCFELNTSNAMFTITQTALHVPLIPITVQGNFIATTNPPPNMTHMSVIPVWVSDHEITNNGIVTLRFARDNNTQRWGATNVTPVALPASGILSTGLTAYAQISGVTNGRYRITFDPQTCYYTFSESYSEASGINILNNSGFEQTTLGSDGGDAVAWDSWQAWPKSVTNGYLPHTGNWCGAIHGQMNPDWTDYGSFAQDVFVDPAWRFGVSAWFLGYAGWTSATMQIKIEWRNSTNGSAGDDTITPITAPSNSWAKCSVNAYSPAGATRARVVFLCSGAVTTGKMLVDDAEMISLWPYYETRDNGVGTVAIVDYWGSRVGALDIPSSIDGKTVTAIESSAFSRHTNLTSVTIPDSVTNIGYSAFDRCTGLTNVTIGSGVTSIDHDAFLACTGLEAFTVDTNNSIYSSANGVLLDKLQTYLIKCPAGIKGSFAIPDSVAIIRWDAFFYCPGLTILTIGSGVTSIGDIAFSGCIGLEAFTVDTNNSIYSSTNGVLFDKLHTYLIQCPARKMGSYAIPDSVTSIAGYAFGYCTGLTDVTIGSGVTNIGDYAFLACTGLEAFTVDTNNSIYSSANGVLFDKFHTYLIQCPARKTGSYAIPDSVTSIAGYAFGYCTGLTSVTIPDSVTNIGHSAFDRCTGLTSATIPDSVTTIGGRAFYYCTGLTNATIGSGVTNIGDYAFYHCTVLEYVTIPDNITSIGRYAFYECFGLTNVTIGSGVTNIGDYAFYHCTGLTRVYFCGNAPALGYDVFQNTLSTIYYLPGTTNWPMLPYPWAGRPTAFWLLVEDAENFGVQGGQFGFNISWATGWVVVVDACTNLIQTNWVPVKTNTPSVGSANFSDPEWTNYPGRFYRLRSAP